MVFSKLDELKETIKEDEEFGPVYLREDNSSKSIWGGFARYSRDLKKIKYSEDIAYGYPHCEKIILGAPKINPVDTTTGPDFLLKPGRQSLDYYCGNCNSGLYIFEWLFVD